MHTSDNMWNKLEGVPLAAVHKILSHWGPERKFASFTGVTRNDYVIGKKKRKRCARSGSARARTAYLLVKSPARDQCTQALAIALKRSVILKNGVKFT